MFLDLRPWLPLWCNVLKSTCSLLNVEVNPALDPLQFAYRQGRGTDDAINNITLIDVATQMGYGITVDPLKIQSIFKHVWTKKSVKLLEDPKVYAQILFADFISSFNTL